MKKLFFVIVLQISGYLLSFGQSTYAVGSSNVSIEPDNDLFSLALAGYGAPRDGRFSITWKYAADLPKILDMVGLDGSLYAINEQHELIRMSPDDFNDCKKVGNLNDAKLLTASGRKLYLLNKQGDVFSGNEYKKAIKWRKIGKGEAIVSWTAKHDTIYAIDKNNELVTARVESKPVLQWHKLGKAKNLVSLALHNGRIYGIDKNNILWYLKLNSKNNTWIEIGRYNEFTYTIDVHRIAVIDDRLYALGADKKLYRAEHRTKGDLSTRAIAIQDNDQTVVLVTMDVTGFNASFADDIKSFIYKKWKIPPSAVMINASHTHFAPVTQAWSTWGDFYHRPDSIYLNATLRTKVLKAVDMALSNLSPSEIKFARGTTKIGVNRRNNYWSNAPCDTTLDVLQIKRQETQKKTIIFSAACHAVFRNHGKEGFTLNANFPRVTRRYLNEKLGLENAIFINGCSGDINPRDENHEKTGTELARDILSSIDANLKSITGKISYALDTILVPVHPWSVVDLENLRNASLAKGANVTAEKNVRWVNLMLENYRSGTMPTTMPILIQTINVGNWKLIALSREAVNEYGPAIRKLWPDKLVTVAAYSNDVSSYLPKDWHIDLKTYEGYESYIWYGQPSGFPRNIFDIVIDRIKANNR